MSCFGEVSQKAKSKALAGTLPPSVNEIATLNILFPSFGSGSVHDNDMFICINCSINRDFSIAAANYSVIWKLRDVVFTLTSLKWESTKGMSPKEEVKIWLAFKTVFISWTGIWINMIILSLHCREYSQDIQKLLKSLNWNPQSFIPFFLMSNSSSSTM